MKKIMLVFGTRPEAIKMAPLVKAFQAKNDEFETIVCVTGQHREMLDQVLHLFDIKPDFDLNIMKQGQDLYDITSRVLLGMRDVFKVCKPDILFVHGDTTTSTAAALAGFYQQIPVAHVEAGLRTNNIYSPWPEEMNRQITGRIATYNLSPTQLSRQNLLKENVDENKITVTGNTVIDALHWVTAKIKSDKKLDDNLSLDLKSKGYDTKRLVGNRRLILITGHRRENFGDGFLHICHAIQDLAKKLFFIEPLEYLPFVFLMEKSDIVLTDSGGIQEEAPGLGKPVLVMRNTTERPEAVDAGTVKLVGTDYDAIVDNVSKLLTDRNLYNKMSKATNPYGDGKACERIIRYIEITK